MAKQFSEMVRFKHEQVVADDQGVPRGSRASKEIYLISVDVDGTNLALCLLFLFEIEDGDPVWLFEQQGKRQGILEMVDCIPIGMLMQLGLYLRDEFPEYALADCSFPTMPVTFRGAASTQEKGDDDGEERNTE